MRTTNPPGSLAADIEAVSRIEAVPTLLRILCDVTGMGFAAVARVTDDRWIACAVLDRIDFGLTAGSELDVHSTLCKESRSACTAIAFDHASTDPVYRDHHTPLTFGIESYVSVPICLPDGEYFGNLCAVDPQPRRVSEPHVLDMFRHFAEMMAFHLAVERTRDDALAALFGERAAGDLREQFVAILGHDLRLPVVAIAETSRALQAKSKDPEVFFATARIGGYARRLLGLIDDMRDLAKTRLGGVDVQVESGVDIDEALRESVDELRQAYPKRVIRLDADLGSTAAVDRRRLQQIVSNLVVNGLTHGAPDGVVSVKASRVDEHLELVVSNHGSPIPAADLPLLFEPFWRKSALGRREGIGLGLYICDRITRAHGGTLTVDSHPSEGTRFRVALPVDAKVSPQHDEPAQRARQA